MKPTDKKALIVVNILKDEAASVAAEAASYLRARNWQVQQFIVPGKPDSPPEFRAFNLLISIGGDGTLLYTARQAAPWAIPVLPVNLGRLGFIACNRKDSWQTMFERWASGADKASRRMMLGIEILSDNKNSESAREALRRGQYRALNDGVLSAQGIAKMIGFSIAAQGKTFGSYRADGLIVATPTGSTGYNLAAGGPALHPEMNAIVVNPICSFTLASRPMVLPGNEILDVEVPEIRRSGIMLTVDGQETQMLEAGDIVRFRRAAEEVLLIVPPEKMFYGSLRTKLGWTGDSDA